MRTELKGLPAGIYLRISDDKEGRELGIARQEEDDRRLADQLGVNVVDIYKDNDISASTRTKKKRPDYRRLLRDAEAGRIKVIIAYTSARITRRPRENEDLIDLAEKYGTVFRYVALPAFDLNTANGRMIARILVVSDAGMAETTAELITRKKLERAKDGKFHGGGRPYGYEKDGITLRLCEAKVIIEAVRRIGAGEIKRPSSAASTTGAPARLTVGCGRSATSSAQSRRSATSSSTPATRSAEGRANTPQATTVLSGSASLLASSTS